MKEQKALSLTSPRNPRETSWNYSHRIQSLNGKLPARAVPVEKLTADLLKRQSDQIMQDVTTCQPVTLPAHIMRLDDLVDLIRHALRNGLTPADERDRSDESLLHPTTLADHLAALAITRQNHRAPGWNERREKQHAEIINQLGIIAAHVQRPRICQICGGGL